VWYQNVYGDFLYVYKMLQFLPTFAIIGSNLSFLQQTVQEHQALYATLAGIYNFTLTAA
jgi:hypothetical protein